MSLPHSVLAAIEALPGVEPALREAIATLDLVRGHRVHRRAKREFLEKCWGSSAQGVVELSGATFLTAHLLVDAASTLSMTREPQRALAALHLIATEASTSSRGVPRQDLDPERMIALAEVIQSEGSGLIIAALVIGEIESMPLFDSGATEVALIAARAVLMERGIDPEGVACLERGIALLGIDAYRYALKKYQGSSRDSLISWITYLAKALEIGAQSSFEIAEGIIASMK